MRKSKSCEDIRINTHSSKASTDINSNVLISNLMKMKPCQKIFNSDLPTAYQLPTQNGNYEANLFAKPEVRTHRKHLRRVYSQDQLDKLINIQEQLKIQALNTLYKGLPSKSPVTMSATAKQLASLNSETLADSLKRGSMGRLVMISSKGNFTKKISTQADQNISSFQSSRTLQSITNRTFQVSKISIVEQNNQHKTLIKQKIKQFEKCLNKESYNQVLKTERRKQAWNAFRDAQRDRIRMLKSEQARNAFIKLNNDLRKIKKNVRKSNRTCQDEQTFIETMNFYKKFGKDFDFLAQNFKFGQK